MGIRFDGVVTAEQVKSYKPSFNHWLRMLKVFKIRKESVLHIAAIKDQESKLKLNK